MFQCNFLNGLGQYLFEKEKSQLPFSQADQDGDSIEKFDMVLHLAFEFTVNQNPLAVKVIVG